jgi:hypothetical protein
MQRRLAPPGVLSPMSSRVKRVVPEGEQGFWTPLRRAASDGGVYWWKCRCGNEVARVARDVVRAAKLGRTPKCSRECTGVKAEGTQSSG